MRFTHFISVLLIVLLTASLSAQEKEQVSIKDNEIVNSLHSLNKAGKLEESIKKSLEILSSEIKLSSKDTFRVYRNLARNLFQIGDYENALEYAKNAVDIQMHFSDRKIPDYLFLMHYFNAAQQYDSSVFYMKKKVNQMMLEEGTADKGLLIKTYNNIGYTFYLNNQPDSAERYYKKIINFDQVKELYAPIYGLATGNLGHLYFIQGDYKNALKNMKIDASLTKGKIWQSYNNATIGIAECYSATKDYKKAKKALLEFFKQKRKDNKSLKRAYLLMGKVLHKLNDNKGSRSFLNKYIVLNDSLIELKKPNKELVNQLSKAKVDLISKDLALAKNKVDLMNASLVLAKTKEKTQAFRNKVYIATLILFLISIILSVVYHRNRQKKKIEIHQLETSLITKELQHKKKDLNNLAANLTYKRKFIEEVLEKLKTLKEQPESEFSNNVTLLIREFNSYKSADKNIEVLQSDIDKINLSFFKKLESKYPLLTEKEKEMCGLFALNLSSKDIAIIRNITPNAVKKARQRIRKKLPISADEKLTTFFSDV